MRFRDRIALVTGAASGIGLATAQRLAEEGARLALVDRDAEALEHAAATLPRDALLKTFPLDVADEAAVEACVAAMLALGGRIDVLCNNAGISGGLAGLAIATEQDLAEWSRVVAVNLFGVVHFTKYAARAMVAAGGGAIVNTASVAGLRSGAGGNAYSASKAAVISFTPDFGLRSGAMEHSRQRRLPRLDRNRHDAGYLRPRALRRQGGQARRALRIAPLWQAAGSRRGHRISCQ